MTDAIHSGQTSGSGGTLVIQPLPGIGDMVWHLPHIHSIAAMSPDGQVTLMTKATSHADRLFAADPTVREVMWVERNPRPNSQILRTAADRTVDEQMWLDRNPSRHDGLSGFFTMIKDLRARGFDEAWVLHGSGRYAWAARLAGIPRRIGFGQGLRGYALSKPIALLPAEQRAHPIERADRLLALAGVPRTEIEPQLRVVPAAREEVARRYADRPRPWIALGIGCSEANRQWGRENFAALADALHKSRPCSVFLLGGPAEHEMAAWIADRLRATGTEVADATDLPLDQSVAVLAECTLCVANDTGVLNLALGVGVNAVGLFGNSSLPRYSPHLHAVKPTRDGGMQGIDVDTVLAFLSSTGLW
jgi:heptosyltransferase-2